MNANHSESLLNLHRCSQCLTCFALRITAAHNFLSDLRHLPVRTENKHFLVKICPFPYDWTKTRVVTIHFAPANRPDLIGIVLIFALQNQKKSGHADFLRGK